MCISLSLSVCMYTYIYIYMYFIVAGTRAAVPRTWRPAGPSTAAALSREAASANIDTGTQY